MESWLLMGANGRMFWVWGLVLEWFWGLEPLAVFPHFCGPLKSQSPNFLSFRVNLDISFEFLQNSAEFSEKCVLEHQLGTSSRGGVRPMRQRHLRSLAV